MRHLSVPEFAKEANYSDGHVRRLLRKGELKGKRVGERGKWQIPEDQLPRETRVPDGRPIPTGYRAALMPVLSDDFAVIYEEIYIHEDRLIDRGRSIRVPKDQENDIGTDYLREGFSGEIKEAKFVNLKIFDAETGEFAGVDTVSLALGIDVKDRQYPKSIVAYYPLDVDFAEGGFSLLPSA